MSVEKITQRESRRHRVEKLNEIFANTHAFKAVIKSLTVTAYTLLLLDVGKYIRISNANPITVTVPPDSSASFPVGSSFTFVQADAGVITLAPGSGVTLNAIDAGLSTKGTFAALQLVKIDTDTWDVIGGVS
jgi:hypothetical protein